MTPSTEPHAMAERIVEQAAQEAARRVMEQGGASLFDTPNLCAALQKASEEVRPVRRDVQGDRGGSYSSADAVFTEARLALHAVGVRVEPVSIQVHPNGRWLDRQFRLLHIESGESRLSAPFPWPIEDSHGDAFGSALTRSYRYFLRDLLLINQEPPKLSLSGSTVEPTAFGCSAKAGGASVPYSHSAPPAEADAKRELLELEAARAERILNKVSETFEPSSPEFALALGRYGRAETANDFAQFSAYWAPRLLSGEPGPLSSKVREELRLGFGIVNWAGMLEVLDEDEQFDRLSAAAALEVAPWLNHRGPVKWGPFGNASAGAFSEDMEALQERLEEQEA